MKSMTRALPVAMICASLLAACGGGSGGGTPAATSIGGTISGLGSIVVNGVRYQTIGASVRDLDNSNNFNIPLALGMTVIVDPSAGSTTAASTIRVQSGIHGPAAVSGSTLKVGGLPVSTDTSTFIVDASGAVTTLASLNGTFVEAYGLPQADGTFKATRIEIESAPEPIQLVGVVSALNTTNKTFSLGSSGSGTVTVTYTTQPGGLANGAVVSVRTGVTGTATSYTATNLYVRAADVTTYVQYASRYSGTTHNQSEANELYGMVSNKPATTTASGAGCSFQVQGVTVSVSAAATSSALCNAIQNGDYVEAKGVLANGVLTASRIEFKTAIGRDLPSYRDDVVADGLRYSRINTTDSANPLYEIYGTLSACTNPISSCTLTSNGSTYIADLSSATWEHGIVGGNNNLVEAKGYTTLTATSPATFKVTSIEIKQ